MIILALIYIVVVCLAGTLVIGAALTFKTMAGGDVTQSKAALTLLNFFITAGCICGVILAAYFVFLLGL